MRVLYIIIIACLTCTISCHNNTPQNKEQAVYQESAEISYPLNKKDAVRLAHQAAVEHLYIPEGIEPTILERGDNYVITWPTNWPEGILGGDFYAEVIINRNTGVIERIASSD